jgi:hypothetical protein
VATGTDRLYDHPSECCKTALQRKPAITIRLTVSKFGHLDVLHNNSGGSTEWDDTSVNAPLDDFWRAIKLPFLGCHGIPEPIKAGGGST